MARTPHATHIYDTHQKGPRVPAGNPTHIVLHHAATRDFDLVIRLEMGAKELSSTVVIKDDKCASMFDEQWRAWSLSSQYWDSISLCSETCNETGAPGWTLSEATYGTLAKVVADWCFRYNIPLDREHVLGHREVYTRHGASYATSCPGGMDLDRVVRDAAPLLAELIRLGGQPPAPVTPPVVITPVVTPAPQPTGGTVSIVDKLIQWARANPKRDGRSWDQWCGSLMYRLCSAFGTPPNPTPASARIAWRQCPTAGRNLGDAPIGTFGYWWIGAFDHVGISLGNGYYLMASRHCTVMLGDAIGIIHHEEYRRRSGAVPYGWSYKYGANGSVAGQGTGPAYGAVTTPATTGGGGSGSGWAFNRPSAAVQQAIQKELAWYKRYSGAQDGVWGVNSIKGIQLTVKNVGYTGPIDGIEGPNLCYYIQVYAKKFGDYTGPLDKVLGPNSWAGFLLGLARH